MTKVVSTDIQRLVSTAIQAANSKSVSDVERCVDVLRYLKSLNLSSKDIRLHSPPIHALSTLKSHKNPKIVTEVNVLLDSWLKTLYSSGRNPPSTTKTKRDERSLLHTTQIRRVVSKLNKTQKDERSFTLEIKQKKPNDRKSFASNPKKQSTKLSENPRPNLKENAREMLELFDIAKKSADVANTKGLLLSKPETTICVDTLSLLISFPISSTAIETRKIMEKLQHLTKHKDRKICNSASALLHHWRQCITESQ